MKRAKKVKDKKLRLQKIVTTKKAIKKRKPRKKITSQSRSSHVWYCKAVSSQGSIGGKGATKQIAKNVAMHLCRTKIRTGRTCKILNCFLMR